MNQESPASSAQIWMLTTGGGVYEQVHGPIPRVGETLEHFHGKHCRVLSVNYRLTPSGPTREEPGEGLIISDIDVFAELISEDEWQADIKRAQESRA